MNILQKADSIVFQRSEESERQYGPFSESMKLTAEILEKIGGPSISSSDACLVLVALKLAREKYAHKEDNILDAIAYLAMYNHILEKEKNELEVLQDRSRCES